MRFMVRTIGIADLFSHTHMLYCTHCDLVSFKPVSMVGGGDVMDTPKITNRIHGPIWELKIRITHNSLIVIDKISHT